MNNEQFWMEQTARIMSDPYPVVISSDIKETWLIISCLQLATRHPYLSDPIRTEFRRISGAFERVIVDRYPEAAELIARGWDSAFDVPRSDAQMDQADDYDPSDFDEDDLPF